MEEETFEDLFTTGQQLTTSQTKQVLAKKYWNYDKISAWVESLPQVQEYRKQQQNPSENPSPQTTFNPEEM